MSNNSKDNTLKQKNEELVRQLNLISSQAIQLKDIAQTNEIVLHKTLRFLTGKLLALKKSDKVNEDIDKLIEYLNRYEEQNGN